MTTTLGIGFTFCVIFLVFINPAFSENNPSRSSCKSITTFANKKTFEKCIELNTFNAILHYTYNHTQSTFTMAFTVPQPLKYPYRWVAFALNPTQLRMSGSQALIAYKPKEYGPIYADKLNIVSYTNITFGPISYEVTGLSAEEFDDKITIFGRWIIPTTPNMLINVVWQVGGVYHKNHGMHELKPENLKSMMQLNLLANAPPIRAPETSPAPAPRNDSSDLAPIASSNDSNGPALVEPKKSGSAPQGAVSMVLVFAAIMVCFL